MIAVYDVVAVHAILVFLHNQPGRCASLQEISDHFDIPWAKALQLLWEANTVDFPGEAAAFEIDLPLPEQLVEPGEDPAGPDSLVTLDAAGNGILSLDLMLDEVLVLVGILDSIIEITPLGGPRTALLEVRSKLRSSAEVAGFGSAIWQEPRQPIATESLETIARAIEEKRHIFFDYYRPSERAHAQIASVDVVPHSIESGTNPVIVGSAHGERRTYRLDRIANVQSGEISGRAERLAAKAAGATWNPNGQEVSVTVTPAGRWAGETIPGAVIREATPNLVISMKATSMEWLASLLVQLGESVVDIQPQSVARKMSTILREYL